MSVDELCVLRRLNEANIDEPRRCNIGVGEDTTAVDKMVSTKGDEKLMESVKMELIVDIEIVDGTILELAVILEEVDNQMILFMEGVDKRHALDVVDMEEVSGVKVLKEAGMLGEIIESEILDEEEEGVNVGGTIKVFGTDSVDSVDSLAVDNGDDLNKVIGGESVDVVEKTAELNKCDEVSGYVDTVGIERDIFTLEKGRSRSDN